MNNEEKALEYLEQQAKIRLLTIIEWLTGKGMSNNEAEDMLFNLITDMTDLSDDLR